MRTNSLKGRTYEEIYGKERAEELREIRRKNTLEQWENGTYRDNGIKIGKSLKGRVRPDLSKALKGRPSPNKGRKYPKDEYPTLGFRTSNKIIIPKVVEQRKGKTREEIWGKEKSKEIGEKQSQTLKEGYKNGRIISWSKGLTKEDHPSILAISEKLMGKELSERHKENLSISNKGKSRNKGRHLTEEHKRKITETKKKQCQTKEFRQKMRDINLGTHPSEETLKKMSDFQTKRFQSEEEHKKHSDACRKNKSTEEIIRPYIWNKIKPYVRKRDKHICQYCGEYPSFVVHHIIPRRVSHDDNTFNLITLCSKCHRNVEVLTRKYLSQGIDPIEIFYEKWSENTNKKECAYKNVT